MRVGVDTARPRPGGNMGGPNERHLLHPLRGRPFQARGLRGLRAQLGEHHATADAVLFAMSDEPVMRFCKYWKFEALD
jgi:hypothetical protein